MANSLYLEALLAAEDDAITIVNKDMEVLYWNEAAVNTYQIEKEEILHQKIDHFFHHDDLMVRKVLKTKEPVKNKYHRPRKDKHVVINAAPVLDHKGDVIGAVSIERDISQIVKLNDHLVSTSAELQQLRQQINTQNEESPFSKLKGSSHALQQTVHIARKAAKTDATVLILGESGTGKEICARAIHEASPRSKKPFIPINCGAIPSALFESELFGYEGGAFTGAEKKGKAGKIEIADGGTIFLDEVGELPLDMQVKLLRVLQEKVIYRIGGTKGRKVDVRFIAATNQNLHQLMKEKKFRSDLYYRLNVIQITMPPLRERIIDIQELVPYFLKQFSEKYETPVPKIDEEALSLLFHYDWPGNVRELRNIMERMVILAEDAVIQREHLEKLFHHTSQIQLPIHENKMLPLKKGNLEKQLILETLEQNNGNKSATAKKLGISRVTLYKRLKKYGLME